MARKRKSAGSPVTRSVASARTGVHIETVRYYERIGLFEAPPRSAGGHRHYDEVLLRRLNFIRRCRDLGFGLDEVRSLLRLVDGGSYSCAEVKAITLDHLRDVRAKISHLKVIERTLDKMSSQCDDGQVPECPVIDALFGENG